MRRTALCLRVAGMLSLAALVGSPAWAQSASGQRWTVEVTGGIIRPFDVGGGDITLPPAGAPIATTSPVYPSRQVPTWFLGDGARLLNLVNAELGVQSAITPLDDALKEGVPADVSGTVGFRVTRRLSARYAVQVSLDVLPGSAGVPATVIEAASVTATSFESAFAGLFGSGPYGDVIVAATTSGREGSGRELALVGAVQYFFEGGSRFEPFMTLGGGVIAGIGDPASVTLDGRYQALIVAEGANVPIVERDRLTASYDYRTALVGVIGGGFRRAVSDTWGVVVDGRVIFGQPATQVFLDSEPEVTTGTPADFIESFTTPAIQFSNSPSTGRVSSLGAPGLDRFEAFSANGLQVRAIITAGIFVRF